MSSLVPYLAKQSKTFMLLQECSGRKTLAQIRYINSILNPGYFAKYQVELSEAVWIGTAKPLAVQTYSSIKVFPCAKSSYSPNQCSATPTCPHSLLQPVTYPPAPQGGCQPLMVFSLRAFPQSFTCIVDQIDYPLLSASLQPFSDMNLFL